MPSTRSPLSHHHNRYATPSATDASDSTLNCAARLCRLGQSLSDAAPFSPGADRCLVNLSRKNGAGRQNISQPGNWCYDGLAGEPLMR
jgi:hypothetical protein